MSHTDNHPSEQDCLAFVDGQLSPAGDTYRRVLRAMQSDPALAQRIRQDQAQREQLARTFDATLKAPIPPRLDPAGLRARQRGQDRRRLAMAASVVLGVTLGVVMLSDEPQTGDEELERFAAISLTASQQPASAPHSDTPVDEPPAVLPAGFKLTGIQDHDTISEWHLMDRSGKPLQLFIASSQEPRTARFHASQHGDKEVVYWRRGDRLFALVGERGTRGDLTQSAKALSEISPAAPRQLADTAPPSAHEDDLATIAPATAPITVPVTVQKTPN